jgi:hypothetical protein
MIVLDRTEHVRVVAPKGNLSDVEVVLTKGTVLLHRETSYEPTAIWAYHELDVVSGPHRGLRVLFRTAWNDRDWWTEGSHVA